MKITHKARRYNSFPQIKVINVLFSFKTVKALVCHPYKGSGIDRKKRKALSALEVTFVTAVLLEQMKIQLLLSQ